jgi:hypothetical protein
VLGSKLLVFSGENTPRVPVDDSVHTFDLMSRKWTRAVQKQGSPWPQGIARPFACEAMMLSVRHYVSCSLLSCATYVCSSHWSRWLLHLRHRCILHPRRPYRVCKRCHIGGLMALQRRSMGGAAHIWSATSATLVPHHEQLGPVHLLLRSMFNISACILWK